MAEFKISFSKTMAAEGGYANAPSDRGKETYRGISRAMNPQWKGWAIVDALRKEPGFPKNLASHPELDELVLDFYKEMFWNPIKGDQIASQEVADELFDTGVNMGATIPVKFAQQALNLLNRNGKLYADIADDGIMGNGTLKMLNAFTETNVLVRTLNALQACRYIKICEIDHTQEENFRGWLLKRAS